MTANCLPSWETCNAGGVPLRTLDGQLLERAAFQRVRLEYEPSGPRLRVGLNAVEVEQVADRVKNAQGQATTFGFDFP